MVLYMMPTILGLDGQGTKNRFLHYGDAGKGSFEVSLGQMSRLLVPGLSPGSMDLQGGKGSTTKLKP